MADAVLTAQVESLSKCMFEWALLHQEHYDELALNKQRVPLAPDYDRYRQLDAAGVMVFVTLRDGPALVGYYVGFVMPCLHYGIKSCTTDIFWVTPRARNRFGGVRLFRAVKRELQRLEVVRWFVGEKLHRPATRLLTYLGFKPIETHYSMML